MERRRAGAGSGVGKLRYHPPTPWDADGAVEYLYDVLNLLVDACVEAGDIPIVGGDLCLHWAGGP